MTAQTLRIGDTTNWNFIGKPWADGPEGELRPSTEFNHTRHLAFYTEKEWSDVKATFKFCTHSKAEDSAFVFRAVNARCYYAVTFPFCGMQARNKHFWVCVSKTDESGFARELLMTMVPGVVPQYEKWFTARVECTGPEIRVWIEDTPIAPVYDHSYYTGRVGLWATSRVGYSEFRDVKVEGVEVGATPWRPVTEPATNWFYPCPDTTPGPSQAPMALFHASGRDILMVFGQGGQTLVCRSSDGGRAWSAPKPITYGPQSRSANGSTLLMHRSRDGRVCQTKSLDDGNTWSEPEEIEIAGKGPWSQTGFPSLHVGAVPRQLPDGTLLSFGYTMTQVLPAVRGQVTAHTWGGTGSQAWAMRSTDGGSTWSQPTNMDGVVWPGMEPGQIDGSHDPSEVDGCLTSDGSVFCLARPQNAPFMWQTRSVDGGKTWAPMGFAPWPGYGDPHVLRTATGAIVVNHRYPGQTIHVSFDDGRSWCGFQIDDAMGGATAMIEVEPDLLLVAYNEYSGGPEPSLIRAQLLRVTRAGIKPG